MEIEEKIKATFQGFPGVGHVWTDDKEVYFDEREGCRKVTRSEFFSVKPKTKKEDGK